MTPPFEPFCTCMQYAPHEHLALWHARAMPIVQRLVMHEHGVDTERMEATVALIVKMETGAPECF